MTRKRRFLIAAVLFAAALLGAGFLGLRRLRSNVYELTGGAVTIGRVSLFPFGVAVRPLELRAPGQPWLLRLVDLRLRPLLGFLFTGGVAFASPGEIRSPETGRRITISGSLSGNYKKGDVRIGKTTVILESLGNVEVAGVLGEWGQKTAAVDARLKDVMIGNILDFFKIKAAVRGTARGTIRATVDKKSDIQRVDFDLAVSGLGFEENPAAYEGTVKGTHHFALKKTEVAVGELRNASGGKISFRGVVQGEEFDLSFDSDGLTVEEVLRSLPKEWREKIKIEEGAGTVSMKGFSVAGNPRRVRVDGDISVSAPRLVLVPGAPSEAPAPARTGPETIVEMKGRIFADVGELVAPGGSLRNVSLLVEPDGSDIRAGLSCGRAAFGGVAAERISALVSGRESFSGECFFSFHGAAGRATLAGLTLSAAPDASAVVTLDGVDLRSLSAGINEEIVINGTVDATASVLVRRGDPVAELSFASVRKRGVKQALNFGAVKALMQLTGNYGSAMSGISKADFNYSTLAGRVTYRDGYVTLEGLAGVKGPNQILLKGPAIGQGINIFVNSTTNTIRLEDLRRRIENALSTFG